jgi:hypothetical protein
MDDQRLEEIAERAHKSSDGLRLDRIDHGDDEVLVLNSAGRVAMRVSTWDANGFMDADFIVHAKADVLALREALFKVMDANAGLQRHAEAAEAELLRLREGMRVKLELAWDDGYTWCETHGHPSQRDIAVGRLLVSPAEEKVT